MRFVGVVTQDLVMHRVMATYAHRFVTWLDRIQDVDITEVFDPERSGGLLSDFIEEEDGAVSVRGRRKSPPSAWQRVGVPYIRS